MTILQENSVQEKFYREGALHGNLLPFLIIRANESPYYECPSFSLHVTVRRERLKSSHSITEECLSHAVQTVIR